MKLHSATIRNSQIKNKIFSSLFLACLNVIYSRNESNKVRHELLTLC